MKHISTLVKDIQDRLTSGQPFEEGAVKQFGESLAKKLVDRLAREPDRPTLRLSNLGTPCERKLWYSINRPELAEPIGASARLKFLFGDILEEFLLFLARAAGHSVSREQEEVNLHGVKGHIDGFIDNELVDCKSASSFGFKKFEAGGPTRSDDPFGYLTQLDGYIHADTSGDTVGTRGHFLAVDKQLGHIALSTHDKTDTDYEKLVAQKREMLEKPIPPPRGYHDEPDGKSGNRKLGIACSYCAYKQSCWPGLRSFVYSRGPVFLTHVARTPDVAEL